MWICLAYTLTTASQQAITDWALALGLPAQAPHKMHLTAAYCRSGLDDERVKDIVGPASFSAHPIRVDCFDSGDRTTETPIVLVCDGTFVEHAVALRDQLDEMGISVVRHDDGYNPHITLGKTDAENAQRFLTVDPPSLELEIDGIVELHALKNAR